MKVFFCSFIQYLNVLHLYNVRHSRRLLRVELQEFSGFFFSRVVVVLLYGWTTTYRKKNVHTSIPNGVAGATGYESCRVTTTGLHSNEIHWMHNVDYWTRHHRRRRSRQHWEFMHTFIMCVCLCDCGNVQ